MEKQLVRKEKQKKQKVQQFKYGTWNQASLPKSFQPFHNVREYRAIKIEITTRNIHANIIKEAREEESQFISQAHDDEVNSYN
jgi:hypothetical protein